MTDEIAEGTVRVVPFKGIWEVHIYVSGDWLAWTGAGQRESLEQTVDELTTGNLLGLIHAARAKKS